MNNIFTRLFKYLVFIFLLLAHGCSTVSNKPVNKKNIVYRHEEGNKTNNNNGITSKQLELIKAAYWIKENKNLYVNGKKYSMDCSGVISAIYMKAGIDLQKAYPMYDGGGVERIYQYLKDKQLVYRPDKPLPGDIIFWDNTYDKNNNNKADDYLTHIGMVVNTKKTGDITYIHLDYIHGIVFAYMNPSDPTNKIKNSPMRMASLGATPEGFTNAGELYREAAMGWRLSE